MTIIYLLRKKWNIQTQLINFNRCISLNRTLWNEDNGTNLESIAIKYNNKDVKRNGVLENIKELRNINISSKINITRNKLHINYLIEQIYQHKSLITLTEIELLLEKSRQIDNIKKIYQLIDLSDNNGIQLDEMIYLRLIENYRFKDNYLTSFLFLHYFKQNENKTKNIHLWFLEYIQYLELKEQYKYFKKFKELIKESQYSIEIYKLLLRNVYSKWIIYNEDKEKENEIEEEEELKVKIEEEVLEIEKEIEIEMEMETKEEESRQSIEIQEYFIKIKQELKEIYYSDIELFNLILKIEMKFNKNSEYFYNQLINLINKNKTTPNSETFSVLSYLFAYNKDSEKIQQLYLITKNYQIQNNQQLFDFTLRGFIDGQFYQQANSLFYNNIELILLNNEDKNPLVILSFIQYLIQTDQINQAWDLISKYQLKFNSFLIHYLLVNLTEKNDFIGILEFIKDIIDNKEDNENNNKLEIKTIEIIISKAFQRKEYLFILNLRNELIKYSNYKVNSKLLYYFIYSNIKLNNRNHQHQYTIKPLIKEVRNYLINKQIIIKCKTIMKYDYKLFNLLLQFDYIDSTYQYFNYLKNQSKNKRILFNLLLAKKKNFIIKLEGINSILNLFQFHQLEFNLFTLIYCLRYFILKLNQNKINYYLILILNYQKLNRKDCNLLINNNNNNNNNIETLEDRENNDIVNILENIDEYFNKINNNPYFNSNKFKGLLIEAIIISKEKEQIIEFYHSINNIEIQYNSKVLEIIINNYYLKQDIRYQQELEQLIVQLLNLDKFIHLNINTYFNLIQYYLFMKDNKFVADKFYNKLLLQIQLCNNLNNNNNELNEKIIINDTSKILTLYLKYYIKQGDELQIQKYIQQLEKKEYYHSRKMIQLIINYYQNTNKILLLNELISNLFLMNIKYDINFYNSIFEYYLLNSNIILFDIIFQLYDSILWFKININLNTVKLIIRILLKYQKLDELYSFLYSLNGHFYLFPSPIWFQTQLNIDNSLNLSYLNDYYLSLYNKNQEIK
ncbi:hypothetical protein K502DRAFT_346964 [Neoconidiobolus thromboides FSU 785]|nr:hypothetical protein K502DRAFT_346964 [Neoconidiobolus thromboides FSU 785]